MIVLREYQQRAEDELRSAYRAGKRAPLLVMPTGSGKTRLFSRIAQGAAAKGKRVLVQAHRIELVQQIADALADEGIEAQYAAAGFPPARHDAQVIVGNVMSVARRLEKLPKPDLLIQDEAHHSMAATYLKIYKHWSKAKMLGVTASPMRTDGRGLGAVYDHMVLGPTTGELIELGFLSPYRAFSWPDVDMAGATVERGEYTADAIKERMKPSVRGNAIDHYRQLADGKRAILFDYSVEESMATAAAFRDAGYAAFHFDGTTDTDVRKQVNRDFREGRIQVLCNVDLCGEGYDLPAIECVIQKRPTASLIVHLQQLGRGLRTFEGKNSAILIDCVGNLRTHGLPDDPREWSLSDAPNRGKRKNAAPALSVRVCAKCWATARVTARACPECGEPFPVKPRQVKQVEGDLVEIQRERERKQARREQGQSQTLDDLIAVYMQRHPDGVVAKAARWAAHVRAGREKKRVSV